VARRPKKERRKKTCNPADLRYNRVHQQKILIILSLPENAGGAELTMSDEKEMK